MKSENAAIELGQQLGLNENYRRKHIGQGTANICYCFDNAFLELLWVENENDIKSSAISPTRLYERSRPDLYKSAPLGIAYRKIASTPQLFESWSFAPPYLKGGSIAVSTDSLNSDHPFIFEALNSTEPKFWSAEKKNGLQDRLGLEAIHFIIEHPTEIEVCNSLKILNQLSDIDLAYQPGNSWGLRVSITEKTGQKFERKIL